MFRSLLFAAAFYLVTALYLVLGSWLLLAPRTWAMEGLRLHALTAVWLLRVIVGTRLEVKGRENIPAGACLIVSKHQSAWDTFGLIPLFVDPAIVLKDELKWIPFYGWFCVKFEHIRVRRERAAAALKSLIAEARSRADAGRPVIIFAEGTRRPPGAEPDYKPGFVAIYEALQRPCVPVALNSGLFWPRRTWARYPGTLVVEILPAIPAGLPRAEFRKRVEQEIEAACDRLLVEGAAGLPPSALGPDATARLSLLENNKGSI